MKVICDRSALVEAFNLVGGVIATRTPKVVLQCIKLSARDGVLTLSGTDLEAALRFSTDRVEIEREGEALVPADKLGQICRESADSTLTIDVEDDKAVVRGADSRFTIYGYAPSEFPALVDASKLKPTFSVEAGQMRTLIERTLFATARENSRYAINGVLVKRTGKKIDMVATDGRRLAISRGTCATEDTDGEMQCIIPTKALNLLLKLTDPPDRTIYFSTVDSQIVFLFSDGDEDSTAGTMLVSNLVEGSFPPYEDVVPKDLDKKACFDVDTLISAVRRAALLTNEESKGVRLSFSGGQLTIQSRAPELGEAEITVPLTSYDGDDLTIGFNPNFITDALKRLDSPEMTLELQAPSKPGMIRSGPEFTYVLMPVSLA
ncbi:MAG: DNA polymerase III subunit beta [Planctomycetes bacterium]|nr:DNA polymerase III subunit beta [Planctomycetota bacterium]